MKQFRKRLCQRLSRLTRKQWIRFATGFSCLVLAGCLAWISSVICGSQLSQQMAKRWDKEGNSAQISCFFSDSLETTPDTIRSFEYSLDTKLKEASITAPNEQARLWISAYSAKGQVTLSSSRASVSVGAYGVGGDYFQFHPLVLEPGGMYFSDDDIMQDKVILDQNTAWQLFGSYDISGQPITIGSGENAHIGVVAGVVASESGWMNEKAGGTATTVYLSYDMLDAFGWHSGINVYEIVMPNPITGFAKDIVTENIGYTEDQVEIVENSSRFSFLSLLSVIRQFGTRSMNTKAIIYPYWENAARGWEDILSILLVIQILLLTVPAVLALLWLRKCWKNRPFHMADVKRWLSDQQEAHWARQAKRASRKEHRDQ